MRMRKGSGDAEREEASDQHKITLDPMLKNSLKYFEENLHMNNLILRISTGLISFLRLKTKN
jgi:hypothetical protein